MSVRARGPNAPLPPGEAGHGSGRVRTDAELTLHGAPGSTGVAPPRNPLPQSVCGRTAWRRLGEVRRCFGGGGTLCGALLLVLLCGCEPVESGAWGRVLRFQDYNTRIVVFGTTVLGLACGTVGSFTLLRRRALMGDAISHATLPGIVIAFMASIYLGAVGKNLAVLLIGATFSGVLGMLGILLVRQTTRLKEDAALGIVLSVFFGAGVTLMGIAQQMPAGHAAGLEAFIYGKTASMVRSDAWMIAIGALIATGVCALLFKELRLLCFDDAFAQARGFPAILLEIVLMGLVVTVTIIGLQAVGLVLMIALLVTPAAAARFWTESTGSMTVISAGIGAVSAAVGSALSAVYPRLPSGAMIVLVATVFFGISMFLGIRRGVVVRLTRRLRLNRSVMRDHLLRAIFERLELRREDTAVHDRSSAAVRIDRLQPMRSWTPKQLRRFIRAAQRDGLVVASEPGMVRLTRPGVVEAARLVRQHRLWELYLMNYADIAPSHVDRGADAIEHIVNAEIIDELEQLMDAELSARAPIQSPHPLGPPPPGGGETPEGKGGTEP